MTKSNISTVPAKFDRRSALKGAAMLPAVAVPFIPSASVAGDNDRAIIQMVAEHARYSDWVDSPACITDEDLDAGMEAANKASDPLPDTPADSFIGVREKVRWLQRPENFNSGCFEGEGSFNRKVLLSVFADIQRLV
ncbi:hypothetical protein [Sneathiella sp.]|uniref:hypothetical protein n=1 Tax=Sneathiella sp. TaxID=1964365 RepID=UPI0026394F0D|nr:hypothetical protein [Sneathiella sp.]MDF2366314.1 hypothetical protein [Sneathiella sp.]